MFAGRGAIGAVGRGQSLAHAELHNAKGDQARPGGGESAGEWASSRAQLLRAQKNAAVLAQTFRLSTGASPPIPNASDALREVHA